LRRTRSRRASKSQGARSTRARPYLRFNPRSRIPKTGAELERKRHSRRKVGADEGTEHDARPAHRLGEATQGARGERSRRGGGARSAHRTAARGRCVGRRPHLSGWVGRLAGVPHAPRRGAGGVLERPSLTAGGRAPQGRAPICVSLPAPESRKR